MSPWISSLGGNWLTPVDSRPARWYWGGNFLWAASRRQGAAYPCRLNRPTWIILHTHRKIMEIKRFCSLFSKNNNVLILEQELLVQWDFLFGIIRQSFQYILFYNFCCKLRKTGSPVVLDYLIFNVKVKKKSFCTDYE